MTSKNPYQPPSSDLPEKLRMQLEAADWEARRRKTSAVPDADFWLAAAAGATLLGFAVSVHPVASYLLFAWLGGCIRVCTVYSARARAALPPLNAHWLLLTSTAVCFTLQAVVVAVAYVLAAQLRWQAGVWMVAVFLGSVPLYIILFLVSVHLAKQT